MRTAAIIVAAGRGTRAGGEIPKQYQLLKGIPILYRTVAAFLDNPRISQVIVVTNPADAAFFSGALQSLAQKVTTTPGADSRGGSVQAGLNAVTDGVQAVLIHDAARPMVSCGVIDRVLDALHTHAGAAPGLAVTDALWRGEADLVTALQPRAGLFRAQTPQGFHLEAIRAAHAAHPGQAADDVEVALTAGLDVAIVEGDESNIKITHPGDFARAERLLEDRMMDIRTGNGFDVHRFGPGDHVTLCGVTIPHSRGLQGHSDADVGMHALTDAIYGALARGDIGQHFPPSDMQWKGAASDIFLRHAAQLVLDEGFAITHCDITLICETPKIGPHAPKMRDTLAKIIGIDSTRISVKATTSERLGFTGREEGIAAIATTTLVKT